MAGAHETIGLFSGSRRGWHTASARPGLAPRFFFDRQPGPSGTGSLAMAGGGNPACFGYWARAVPVEPGRHYRLRALWRFAGMADPNLHVLLSPLAHARAGQPLPARPPQLLPP